MSVFPTETFARWRKYVSCVEIKYIRKLISLHRTNEIPGKKLCIARDIGIYGCTILEDSELTPIWFYELPWLHGFWLDDPLESNFKLSLLLLLLLLLLSLL